MLHGNDLEESDIEHLNNGLAPNLRPVVDGYKNGLGRIAPAPLDGVPTRPRNRILAALPSEVWMRLNPLLHHVLLIPGTHLQRAGEPLERVYFPNSGLVSLVMDESGGGQVEVSVIGQEGMVGTLAALGNGPSFHHAIVEIAGTACWISPQVLREEFRRGGVLQDWMMRHLQVMTAQACQCALCNRVHSVEERLSRWLLTVRDRIGSDQIEITHEFIAQMLGTRRSGVTVALGVLQRAGMIDLTRGHIEILDAAQLRNSACECYACLKTQFDTLK